MSAKREQSTQRLKSPKFVYCPPLGADKTLDAPGPRPGTYSESAFRRDGKPFFIARPYADRDFVRHGVNTLQRISPALGPMIDAP